jgi:hypothetical protein
MTDLIAQLIRETDAHDGLAPVDLDRFWHEDAIAARDPFGADIPQVPLNAGIWPDNIWDELGLPEDNWRYLHDDPWRVQVARAYNDQSQRIVGRRFLDDAPADPDRTYPAVPQLHDIFEARQQWHAGSWWLPQTLATPDELARLLLILLSATWAVGYDDARVRGRSIPPT